MMSEVLVEHVEKQYISTILEKVKIHSRLWRMHDESPKQATELADDALHTFMDIENCLYELYDRGREYENP
tara:strand:+ start:266 stop:478 length:213 start_codon:yes stop_codon:yes gene_type:complete